MRKINLLLAVAIIAVFASCNNKKQNSINEIKTLEKEVYADSVVLLNQKTANKLLELYVAFDNKYPNDTLNPIFLFKAGELAMNMSRSTQAIVLLNKFEKRYPNNKKAPYCIFFQAFIYENQLHNLDKAKEYYERFINDFPNHELTDDAQISINNLGKSLEDIINGFDKNAAKDSVVASK